MSIILSSAWWLYSDVNPTISCLFLASGHDKGCFKLMTLSTRLNCSQSLCKVGIVCFTWVTWPIPGLASSPCVLRAHNVLIILFPHQLWILMVFKCP